MKKIKSPPLMPFTASLAAGIALGLHAPTLAIYSFTACVCFILLSICMIRYSRFTLIASIIFFMIGIFLAFTFALFPKSHFSRLISPNRQVSITGRIDSMISRKVKGRKVNQSFILRCERIKLPYSKLQPTTGQLQVFGINLGRDLNPGDCLRLRGKLDEPRAVALPGLFDFKAYLERNHITHMMMLIGGKQVSYDSCATPITQQMRIDEAREFIKKRYGEIFDSQAASLASALIIGYQKDIPKSIREIYVKTGTAHLLAVSGLNITLVVSFFYFSMVQAGLVSATFWNPFLSMVVASCYSLIAGANPPVVRAALTIFLASLGTITGRESNLVNLLWASLFIALIASPSSLASPSLQLSYLAVYSLMVHMPRASETIFKQFALGSNLSSAQTKTRLVLAFLVQNFLSTLVTFVWLWPIIAFYFNIVSPSSFVANLIAAPLFLLANIFSIVTLGISFISLDLAKHIGYLPNLCFLTTNHLLEFLARLPFSSFYIPSPPIVVMVLYYFGLVIFANTTRRWQRRLGLGFLLSSIITFLWLTRVKPPPSFTIFTFGRNAQVLLRPDANSIHALFVRDRQLAISQLDWTLKPFLKSEGVNQIDRVNIDSRSPASNIKWLGALEKSFHLPGAGRTTSELIVPITFNSRKGNSRVKVRVGYLMDCGYISLLYLTDTSAIGLRYLETLNYRPHVVIAPDTSSINLSYLKSTLQNVLLIIHNDRSAESLKLPARNSTAVSLQDYPLLRIWRHESKIILEQLRTNARVAQISELPILE